MKSVEKNKISSHFLITFSLADLEFKNSSCYTIPNQRAEYNKNLIEAGYHEEE